MKRLAVLVLTVALVLLFSSTAWAFTDVPITHKYAEAIRDLSDRQIINGYTDGSFGPANPITRQQFAKMICLTLDLPVTADMTSPFTDLDLPNGQLYPNAYIAAAYRNGITTGLTATLFGPGNNISRAQVITMTMRALANYYPDKLKSPSVSDHELYDDALTALGVHGEWALLADSNYLLEDDFDIVSYLFWIDEIQWMPDEYKKYGDPWQPMPRQEVAQFLHNALFWVIEW